MRRLRFVERVVVEQVREEIALDAFDAEGFSPGRGDVEGTGGKEFIARDQVSVRHRLPPAVSPAPVPVRPASLCGLNNGLSPVRSTVRGYIGTLSSVPHTDANHFEPTNAATESTSARTRSITSSYTMIV